MRRRPVPDDSTGSPWQARADDYGGGTAENESSDERTLRLVTSADVPAEGAIAAEPSPHAISVVRNPVVDAGLAQLMHAGGVAYRSIPSRSIAEAAAAVADEPGAVLVVALDELDDDSAPALQVATERGAKVLVLVDEDLEELHRLRGARCGGFAHLRDLSSDGLASLLRRTLSDEIPMPADVAHFLVDVASHAREAATTSSRVRLTPRETEALQLLVDGLSNKQIARRMGISDHGAKRLVANIMAKLDAPNRTIAVARVLREGVVEL